MSSTGITSAEEARTLDAILAPIFCASHDGSHVFCNAAAVRSGTAAQSDVPGTYPFQVHPLEHESVASRWCQALASDTSFEVTHRMADAPDQWLKVSVQPVRDDAGGIVKWCGIGARVAAPEGIDGDLALQEQSLQNIIEAIPVMLSRHDSAGRLQYINRRFLDYVGRPQSSMTADRWADLVHPDDRESLQHTRSRAQATGSGYEVRCRLRRHDGAYRWCLGRAEPLLNAAGEVADWYFANIDIHDQLAAEKSVRDNEQRLTEVIDTIPALVWALRADGKMMYLNRRLLEFTGSDVVDYEQYDWQRTVHPEDVPTTLAALELSVAAGKSFLASHRLRRADGEYVWMESRADPLFDHDGNIACWFGLDVDVNDRRQLEAEISTVQGQLQKAAGLAAVAEMSASIAHEIKQPLAAIVANGHACDRWLNAEMPNIERARTTVQRITRDATAAADIVDRVRQLFRRSTPTLAAVDLNALIAESIALMEDDVRMARAQIRVDLSPALPPLQADRVQLQQVMTNLMRNSIEAMAGVEPAKRMLILRTSQTSGGELNVDIVDQGAGIADPNQAFTPFFTTKESGMGLGLGICRSIIEAHGGRISAASVPGEGTTMTFILPAAGNEATSAADP